MVHVPQGRASELDIIIIDISPRNSLGGRTTPVFFSLFRCSETVPYRRGTDHAAYAAFCTERACHSIQCHQTGQNTTKVGYGNKPS